MVADVSTDPIHEPMHIPGYDRSYDNTVYRSNQDLGQMRTPGHGRSLSIVLKQDWLCKDTRAPLSIDPLVVSPFEHPMSRYRVTKEPVNLVKCSMFPIPEETVSSLMRASQTHHLYLAMLY